jgi:hypothetical protein
MIIKSNFHHSAGAFPYTGTVPVPIKKGMLKLIAAFFSFYKLFEQIQ